ncbi:hypothetical protein LPE509_00336 [Legionella pneumophila subsp. pneumophila LPE509]|nr:hypothetical protein LPE509_00336 [Legionella pneumophila subsp. pneumophila LPE509]
MCSAPKIIYNPIHNSNITKYQQALKSRCKKNNGYDMILT